MRVIVALLMAAMVGLSLCAASQPPAKESKKSMSQSALEALYATIPQDSFRNAQGFFAPVVKKYMPVVQSFEREYQTAPNKFAVVERYLPKLEAAIADAKAMKVPPKYEAEKQKYIAIADKFVFALRLVMMTNRIKE